MMIQATKRFVLTVAAVASSGLSAVATPGDVAVPCGVGDLPPAPEPAPVMPSGSMGAHGGAIPDITVVAPAGRRLGILSSLADSDQGSSAAERFDVDMRLLVLSATGNTSVEPGLKLIIEALEGIGIPHDSVFLTRNGKRLSEGELNLEHPANGERPHGRYYGVVLTSDLLAFQDATGTWYSSLTTSQWAQLASYEKKFKARRVAVAAYPRPTYGVEPAGEPLTADNSVLMQPSAIPFSSGLQTHVELPLSGSYQNPAMIVDDAMAKPVALFSKNSSAGHQRPVAAAVSTQPDGREQLNFYFAQSPYLTASYYLAPLWINWITRDKYQGRRRIYLNVQVDDLFMPNGMWNMVTRVPSDDGYRLYRATPDDLTGLAEWQRGMLRRLPKGSSFKVEMAPNGNGVWEARGYASDPLYQTAKKLIPEFHWVSHTFSHPDLDRISFLRLTHEVQTNQRFLDDFIGLDHPNFSPSSIVTPHISGLFNKDALRALFENGIHNVVGDNSRRELWPLNPFHGFFTSADTNGFEGVFVIPRQATVAPVSAGPVRFLESFYNKIYSGFWGRNLSPAEILQLESSRVAKLLMAWRHDPYMFHQGNLWMFDWSDHPGDDGRRRHSILSLWVEFVLRDVGKFMTLPVLSAKMDRMAEILQDRMSLDRCGANTTMSVDGGRITTLAVSSRLDCIVPVTGLVPDGAAPQDIPVVTESYGPDRTMMVSTRAGIPIRIRVKVPEPGREGPP